MSDLLARLRIATTGEDVLSAEVLTAITGIEHIVGSDGFMYLRAADGALELLDFVGAAAGIREVTCTKSLDAAWSLAEALGYYVLIDSIVAKKGRVYVAELFVVDPDNAAPKGESRGTTPALAICAAMVAAKEVI